MSVTHIEIKFRIRLDELDASHNKELYCRLNNLENFLLRCFWKYFLLKEVTVAIKLYLQVLLGDTYTFKETYVLSGYILWLHISLI